MQFALRQAEKFYEITICTFMLIWDGTDNGFYKVNADASTDFETTLGTYNINFWEITEIHKK